MNPDNFKIFVGTSPLVPGKLSVQKPRESGNLKFLCLYSLDEKLKFENYVSTAPWNNKHLEKITKYIQIYY